MTLAQLEEQVAALKETIEDRMAALERIVERLETQVKKEFTAPPSAHGEQNGGAEEDLLPGTECDLVISIPPGETIHLVGKIVSIEAPPAILGLSDEEWATYAEEAEDG